MVKIKIRLADGQAINLLSETPLGGDFLSLFLGQTQKMSSPVAVVGEEDLSAMLADNKEEK